MKTHPVAALFPMLDEERLTAMAEDIKQHGLIHPIVLDKEGQVLDGRNRLAACERAGVAPRYETWEGEDTNGYALAANLLRRDLSPGAKAMIVAVAAANVQMNISDRDGMAQRSGVSSTSLSRARAVLEYAPERVAGVIAGLSLEDAYGAAMMIKKLRMPDAKRIEKIREHIETIGASAVVPDAPELTLFDVLEEHEESSTAEQAPRAEIERQEEVLRKLIRARDILENIVLEAPALDGWAPFLQVGAVRSAVSHIVAAAYKIAAAYNESIEEQSSIRRIK